MREWLRTARKEKGLTMAMIARKLDISESYYCGIENGTRQSKLDMVLASRISQVLDISLDVIAKEERVPKENAV